MKSHLVLGALFLTLVGPPHVGAQVYSFWSRQYGTNTGETMYYRDMATDASGAVYLACDLVSTSGSAAAIQKYDPYGDYLWQVAITNGVGTNTSVQDIVVASPSHVYVCGRTEWTNGLDCFTARLDSLGALRWTATYDGPGHTDDSPAQMAYDAGFNVYVAGESPPKGLVLKYDESGSNVWSKLSVGPVNTALRWNAIDVSTSGWTYAVGSSYSPVTLHVMAVLDDTGNHLASASFASAPWHVRCDTHGNCYVASGDVLSKFAPGGSNLWSRSLPFPFTFSFEPRALFIDRHTDEVVTMGRYYSGKYRYGFARYSSEGEPSLVFVDRLNDIAAANIYMNEGGITDTGEFFMTGSGGTIKYDRNGIVLWSNNGADALRVLADDDVYLSRGAASSLQLERLSPLSLHLMVETSDTITIGFAASTDWNYDVSQAQSLSLPASWTNVAHISSTSGYFRAHLEPNGESRYYRVDAEKP